MIASLSWHFLRDELIFPFMIDPTNPTLAELEASLAISEAQIAAGDLVSADEILAEEQAALARLKGKRVSPRRREAMPRR